MVQKNKAATAGRQLLQGATLGFADEISDRLAAALASTTTGMSYKDALDEARQMTKEAQAYDWDKNKALSFASNIAGGIPLGLTKAGLSGANWVRGAATLPGAVGRGAALGGGYGAAAGFGAGSDSFSDRAGSGVVGGLFGLGVGGATAPLSRLGAGKVDYEKVGKKVAKYAKSPAGKEILKELGMRPDLPEILARAQKIDAAAKKSGINLTLAEKIAQSTSDPLLAKQGVLKQSPVTAGQMENFYKSRLGTVENEGQIVKALREYAEKTGAMSYDEAAQGLIESSQKAAKSITQKLVAEAEPLYAQAYAKQVDPNQLKSLVEGSPIVKNAIGAALKDERFAGQLQGKPVNSIEVLDAAKRIIDEKIASGKNPAAPFDTKAYAKAVGDLTGLADKFAPEYAAARSVYSGQPEQLQMRKAIGDVAKIDPMQAKRVARALYSGTPESAKVSAQALGPDAPKAVGARIFEALGAMRSPTDEASGLPTALANKIAPTSDVSQMLRAYGAGEDLMDTLRVINQAKLGDRFIAGSPTQPLQQGQGALSDAANAALDVKTGGATALMRRMANAMGKKGESPEFYQDMARIMTTDEGMNLLNQAAAAQSRALPNQLATRAASMPAPYTGTTAGQALLGTGMQVPQGVVRSSVSALNAMQPQSGYNPDNDMMLQKMIRSNAAMGYNPDNDPVLQKMLGGR